MSPSALRRNLGFLAGLLALSSVVACSDDDTTPSSPSDASTEAAVAEGGGNKDGSAPDAVASEAGSEAAASEASMEASATEAGAESAASDAGVDGSMSADAGMDGGNVGDATPDVTMVGDATPDVTVMGDAAPDGTLGDATPDAVTGDDGGGSTDAIASDSSDAALTPGIACAFPNPDAGWPCGVETDGGTGWQFAKASLVDGGTLPGASLAINAGTDASSGGLEWIVPFTGPGQTSQILLWLSLPGIDITNKTLTMQVKGLTPVTSDPGNPGYWDLFFQSETQQDGGGSWPWGAWVVNTWTTPSGTLVASDGGASGWQTISVNLSGFSDPNVDNTHVVTVHIDISTPAATAVDAGVTYSTADILFSSFSIQ
jgi:hypothetical protein